MALSLRSDQIEADGALLLVHGGAWDIPNAVLDEHRAGLQEALDTGRVPLHREAGALTVVTETGAALEAHGAFNAGYGAMLNQDGEAELDAGLMAGATLDYGAVVATRRLAHPVRVARRLLTEEGRVRMLAGEVRERSPERGDGRGCGLRGLDAYARANHVAGRGGSYRRLHRRDAERRCMGIHDAPDGTGGGGRRGGPLGRLTPAPL